MTIRLAIRLDETESLNREKIIQVFREKMDGSYVVTREYVNADGFDLNPHYHAVWDTEKTEAAARMFVKRVFEVSGNKEYSVSKERFKDAALEYALKGTGSDEFGKPDIVCYSGLDYNSDSFENFRKNYWNRKQECAKKDPTKNERTKKFQDLIFDLAEEKNVKTTSECVELVLDVLIEQHRLIQRHYVKGVVDYVMARRFTKYAKKLRDDISRQLTWHDENIPEAENEYLKYC